MVSKRIAMKSFADFVSGTEAGKRAILRRYKYPDDQGLAMATYYYPAKSAILEFHRDNHDIHWLLEKAEELDKRSLTPNKSLMTKLRSNARSIRSYLQCFGTVKYQVLSSLKFPFHLSGVTINVTPDIHVLDVAGTERYITFNFAQKKMKFDYVRTIVQCMSYGAHVNSVVAASATFVDVPSGTIYGGVSVTPDLVGELSTQCGKLQAAWDVL